jgi:hypothetical protein
MDEKEQKAKGRVRMSIPWQEGRMSMNRVQEVRIRRNRRRENRARRSGKQ